MDRVTHPTAPKHLLPGAPTDPGAQDASLPDDLVERSTRRLSQLAWLTAAIVLAEGVASNAGDLFAGEDFTERARFWDVLGAGVMIVVSAAVGHAMRRTFLPARVRIRFGMAYVIALGFLLSFTDHADYFWRNGHGLHGVPLLALLILVFPVLVPMRAWSALGMGLVMAAMGPLSMYGLVATLGFEPPQLFQLEQSFPWLAAIVAAFLAHVVHRLGVEVGQARRLGAYDLEFMLGRGGMGEVWRATHRLLARPAAVKLIRSEIIESGNPTALARFKREAAATAALRSPHTVDVYDYGVSNDGRLYYVMELLDGDNLQSLVDTNGPQPPERVAFWMRQICHSLHEAHEDGLVHRDIKPANVVVGRYGQDYDFVKVVDFGLVTLEHGIERNDARLTGDGRIVGTPAFMSPELAISGDVDARSDLYSLGCVAYFLLTGKPVFAGASPIEVIIGHVERDPPSLLAAGVNVPNALEEIVRDCLVKDPGQRPKDAGAIIERLDGLDFAEPWTRQRAQDWWQHHRMEPPRTDVDPTAATQASG